MRKIYFMSGAGNLFTVLDNREIDLNTEKASKLAIALCSENNPSGRATEGFMLLNNSNKFAFECLYFNPDGSSGMMCGNGARCIVKFAKHLDILKSDNFTFEMNGREYSAIYSETTIKIFFGFPENNFMYYNEDSNVKGTYLFNGSDHLVVEHLKNDFDHFNLESFAVPIMKDTKFPKSVNINIYRPNEDGTFSLRTFERGVNKETGACGTGALALGYHIATIKNINPPFTIYPTSKEQLLVDMDKTSMTLGGPAEIIGEANIKL
ncbi:MAG: diaminopimelate epimerase [Candidatus Kapaibacteriales bacterium]